MTKSKKTLLLFAILGIIVIAGFAYLPYLNKLGIARDDWNNLYNAVIRSPDKMIDHYRSDRPADGYLLREVVRFFRDDYQAYIRLNLVLRILSAIFTMLTLCRIWPENQAAAALAGILSVIFPGFMQQSAGISYVPHQTAMLAFCLSLYLTSICLTSSKRPVRILTTVLACILATVNMALMEYYLGMEVYRFGLIFICLKREKKTGKISCFFRSVLKHLPYLLPMLLFVGWRTFLFDATRSGTGVLDDVILPLLSHPRYNGSELLIRFVKNIWKLFVGSWTIPVYTLLNGITAGSFFSLGRFALASAVFGGLIFYLLSPDRTDPGKPADTRRERILFGLICGCLAIFPLTLSSRDITFSNSLDRFSWPGALGAIMVLIGAGGYIPGEALRSAAAAFIVFISTFVQVRSMSSSAATWTDTQNFWQQLMWRAPGLEPGTHLLTSGGIFPEEDYEVFAPANFIYFPYEKEYAVISGDVLNDNSIQNVLLNRKDMRMVREIWVEKNNDQLLALSKPSGNSCLHVIDGENPVYSLQERSRIKEVGSYSIPDRITSTPDHPAVVPFFLNSSPGINWCYYYESIDLAMQEGDPEQAAALADEADEKGFSAGDPFEWLPVIEAYTQSGAPEKAERYLDLLKKNESQAFIACQYFSGKNDPSYNHILEQICQ